LGWAADEVDFGFLEEEDDRAELPRCQDDAGVTSVLGTAAATRRAGEEQEAEVVDATRAAGLSGRAEGISNGGLLQILSLAEFTDAECALLLLLLLAATWLGA
jgi:hypothetical protein